MAIGLFGLTLVTTTSFGTAFLFWIRTDTILTIGSGLEGPREMFLSVIRIPVEVWTNPELRRTGLSFSVPLLFILLTHELGHFFACRKHKIPCTLPYFLPAPILIGTAGAFIRIRARIRTRSQLFDVGAAGPIAGFVALLPLLVYGLAHSPVVRVVVLDEVPGGLGLLVPGQSVAARFLIYLLHGPLEPGMVLNYHPCALAAWVGLLVTSLNLIPVGQLDGGHILYAASPIWYRRLRPLVLASLALLGFLWPGWWLWFGLLLIVAWRHPPVLYPAAGLGLRRRQVALATLIIFLLVFMPVPLSELTILL